jgi:hypothetical protein
MRLRSALETVMAAVAMLALCTVSATQAGEPSKDSTSPAAQTTPPKSVEPAKPKVKPATAKPTQAGEPSKDSKTSPVAKTTPPKSVEPAKPKVKPATAKPTQANAEKKLPSCKDLIGGLDDPGFVVAPPGCLMRVQCPPGKSSCAGDGVDGKFVLMCKVDDKEVAMCE